MSRVALGVLAWRHWVHHGEALEACFADTGATTEAQLRQQVGVGWGGVLGWAGTEAGVAPTFCVHDLTNVKCL